MAKTFFKDKTEILKIVKSFKNKVDYFDVRVGESGGTYINLSQKKIADISRPKSFGGSVRVLHKGGWGFSTFNDLNDLETSLNQAISFAKKVGKSKTVFAKTKVVKDTQIASASKKDFLKVSLAKKVEILKRYDDLAWKSGSMLVNVEFYYKDGLRKKLFISSEGSVIEKEEASTSCLMIATAKNGNTIERFIDHLTYKNFKDILNKEELVKKVVKLAQEIAMAPNVKSGTYDVVMDQSLAGVFAHEAFGHLSEADNIYENPQLASVVKLGTKFGSDILNISDDPRIADQYGSYKYDDDGTMAREAKLLVNGVLVGRLHSRETAGKTGEAPTGHSRAENVFSQPIVRMGVTYIKPGVSKFSDMIKSVKNGIYCIKWQGGMTDHERFTFTAGYGKIIKDGKIGKTVRNVKLTGNLFETLKNVEMVGDDLEFEGGTCGKMGQHTPNTTGAPHIKIKEISIIGA